MSKITLIRHGQASFGTDNYDVLSDIGKLQAEALGDYFASNQLHFDHIVHGQMARQSDTAKIMASAKGFSGDLVTHQGANEFDSDALLAHYLPLLANQSTHYSQIINSPSDWFVDRQNFELIFRGLIELWQKDNHCPFESWSSFRLRVFQMLNELESQFGTDKKIALVTSGGLISATLQAILGFDKQTFMDMNLGINNASISEIKITPYIQNDKKNSPLSATLMSFNNISPLLIKRQKRLITKI